MALCRRDFFLNRKLFESSFDFLNFKMQAPTIASIYFAETAPADLWAIRFRQIGTVAARPRHFHIDKCLVDSMPCKTARWTPAQIAQALGISAPTLRKHYFAEMKRRPGGGTRPGADRPRGATSRKRDGLVAALESEL